MLDRYRTCRWVSNGMQYPLLNCWGLVRLARRELFGLPWLPETTCEAMDKPAVTATAHQILAGMVRSPAAPAAVAFCWRGQLCLHVGLVIEADGRLQVMDIDQGRGMRLTPLREFERRYQRVEYYQ